MKRLLNRLHEADRSGRLFPFGASILIAVSGGPDSVCLALLLRACRRARSFRLAVAHVNHGLRSAADADERWVRDFCRVQGLEFYGLRVNVPRRVAAGEESIEEAARHARYRALLDLARKQKFDCLATAHTADDQAETVLMRLASGSGLWGLAAIVPVRMERGIRIVRPLLGVSKKDLLDALKRARVPYRTDRSNANPDFLRNRVRGELLPRLMRRLNPRIAEHLADVAADAAAWRAWAEGEAEAFLRRSTRTVGARPGRGRAVRIRERSLCRLPEPLRAPVYFKICERVTGVGQHLRREHVKQIEALLAARGPGERRLSLGLIVRRTGAGQRSHIVWSVDPAR